MPARVSPVPRRSGREQPVGPTLTVIGAVAMTVPPSTPMMGRQGIRFAPFRLLLTLFNIRLGVWVLNPRWPTDPAAPFWAPMSGSPMFPQLIARGVRLDQRR